MLLSNAPPHPQSTVHGLGNAAGLRLRPRLHLRWQSVLGGMVLLLGVSVASAQNRAPTPAPGGSIFTCVDAQGRKLTSDRPIAACMDREQRELSPSGTLRRVIPPTLTASEREALAAKAAAEAAEKARVQEEQRRDRALVTRYPTEEAHTRAREGALEQVHAVLVIIERRMEELGRQRKEVDAEMEFYQRDPTKAPAWLQRRSLEINQQQAEQDKRLIEQEAEKRRINERFDEELAKLRTLWAASPTGAPATAASSR